MDRQFAFEREMHPEGIAVLHPARPPWNGGDLPEERFIGAAQWSKRLAARVRVLIENDLHPARLKNLPRPLLDSLMIGFFCSRQQDVRDGEIWMIDRRADQSTQFQLPPPDFTRDVGLDACAVPFTGDLTCAMAHFGKRFERPLDVAV